MLWVSRERSLVLRAILSQEDDPAAIVIDPTAISASILSHWAPIFGEKPFDPGIAQDFVEKWALPLQGKFRNVGRDAMASVLRKQRFSAAGPDQLPYIAWHAAGPAALETLLSLWIWTAAGLPLPIAEQDVFIVFAPKVIWELLMMTVPPVAPLSFDPLR